MAPLQPSKTPKSWAISCLLSLLMLHLLVEPLGATRALNGDRWDRANQGLWLQSLPRQVSPASGASSCTLIPGGKKVGKCTIRLQVQEMHVAGRGLGHGARRIGFPSHFIKMGAASLGPGQNYVVSSRSQ